MWQYDGIKVTFFMEFEMATKYTVIKQKDSENGFQAFTLGLVYFGILGAAHAAAWYFLALKTTLLMTSALPLITAVSVVSLLYFSVRFLNDPSHFKHRTKEIFETAQQHITNHKDEMKSYLTYFVVFSVLTAMSSLILKELLQDISGQLIPLTFLFKPIIFTAATLSALFIIYLAIEPMLTENKTSEKSHFIFMLGSAVTEILKYTSFASALGYCFARFYESYIPTFTFFALSTTMSLVASFAIAGFFVGTIAYLCSDKDEKAASFSHLAKNLFDTNGENSLRRVYKAGGIIVYNVLWAAAAAAITFSALHLIPLGIYPQISAAVFLASLQQVIYISTAVQAVFSLFESAFTMHDHGKVNCFYGNVDIGEFANKKEAAEALTAGDEEGNQPLSFNADV